MDDETDTVPEPAIRRSDSGLRLTRGRYALGATIGKGGMGEVIDARDRQLGRDVAIKRMLSDAPSEAAVQRFLREARVQARLDHPAVVPVHELGVDDDGHPFFAMKKLTGTTLRAILERGDASRQRLLRAFADVCLAIELAHTRGVIHRDLKPENIVLGDFGEVYVLDWGVAKVVDSDDAFGDVSSGGGDHATRAGTTIGTVAYMAPEQARAAQDVDARADVYSLGCILFEILSGARPWPGARRPSEALPASEVPLELDEACERALAEDRDARIASARDLATRIERFLDGDRDVERRRELAREHIDKARAALDCADELERRTRVMREAGHALALDPTRNDAAELISTLMLQPPREAPAEVESALDAERLDLMTRNIKPALGGIAIMFAFSGLVLLTPVPRLTLALIDALLVLSTVFGLLAHRSTRMLRFLPVAFVLAMTGVIALVATAYSPFLMAPAMAASASLTFTFNHKRAWFAVMVAAAMSAAILLPFIGEVVGVLPTTMTAVSDGVLFHTPALRASASTQLVLAIAFVIGLTSSSGWLGYGLRRSELDARRQMHLQAWHLRQLVTSQGA